MKRIVVDTNVLVSGSSWKGKPAEVLDLIEEGTVRLCVSPEIIQEYWEVFTRDFVPEGAKTLLTSLLDDEQIIMVNPGKRINVIRSDPVDNMFLECALEAKAKYIVSGDKHLLHLKIFRGIRILTPQAFIAIIDKKIQYKNRD